VSDRRRRAALRCPNKSNSNWHPATADEIAIGFSSVPLFLGFLFSLLWLRRLLLLLLLLWGQW
jgi:hypothetical protein